MLDRERLDDLVRRYPRLVGLRWVPIGVFYAALGLVAPYRATWGEELLLIPLGIACAAAYGALQAYYARRFGSVRSLRSQQVRDLAVALGAGGLLAAGSLVEGTAPVELVGISTAGFLVLLGAHSGLMGWPTWTVAGVVTAVALAPLFTALSPGPAMAPLMSATIGAALVVRGLHEHHHLVASLRALAPSAHAPGEALS